MPSIISAELIRERFTGLSESEVGEIYSFFEDPRIDFDQLSIESFIAIKRDNFRYLLNSHFRELFLKEEGESTRMTWSLFLQLDDPFQNLGVEYFMACLQNEEGVINKLLTSEIFTLENFISLWNEPLRRIYLGSAGGEEGVGANKQTFLQENVERIIDFLKANHIPSLSNAAWKCLCSSAGRFLPAPLGDDTLSIEDWLAIQPNSMNAIRHGCSPVFSEFKGQLFLLAQLCYSRQRDRKDSQMHAEIIHHFLKEHQEQGASVADLVQIVEIIRGAYQKIFENIRSTRSDDPDCDYPIRELNQLELKLLYRHFNHPQVSTVISRLRLPVSGWAERNHLSTHLLLHPEDMDRIDEISQLSPRSKQAFFQKGAERDISALSSAPGYT